MNPKFGDLLKDFRIRAGLTLRQCSQTLNADPSNWSKLERNISSAPKPEILEQWGKFLKLSPEEREAFMDQASISRKEIPSDLASDERVLEALPVFFRAARGVEMDDAKLAQFIDQVRKLHSPDS
jgi:transcriptional regulator with XRE-family HTH domain